MPLTSGFVVCRWMREIRVPGAVRLQIGHESRRHCLQQCDVGIVAGVGGGKVLQDSHDAAHDPPVAAGPVDGPVDIRSESRQKSPVFESKRPVCVADHIVSRKLKYDESPVILPRRATPPGAMNRASHHHQSSTFFVIPGFGLAFMTSMLAFMLAYMFAVAPLGFAR